MIPLLQSNTVDGRDPAPVDMVNIPLVAPFYASQVMQDFFHQQYVHSVFPIEWIETFLLAILVYQRMSPTRQIMYICIHVNIYIYMLRC